MTRFIAALLIWFGLASAALAQVITMPPPAGVTIMGCVYNASPPTLSTGQLGYAQCNSTGTLAGVGSLVQTSPPSYSNGQTVQQTVGTDGGIIGSDRKIIGPTTVSSATTVATWNTWGYEYADVFLTGNTGSTWVLECSDTTGSTWLSQSLVNNERNIQTTVAFSTFGWVSRISGAQCRVRVNGYNSPDVLVFTITLRRTGSEPAILAAISNQVQTFSGRGSTDPNAGFISTSSYYNSTALESGHVIKAGAGMLTQICASATAAVTLQLFNSTTVPANATPVSPAPVALKQIASGAKGCIPEQPGGMAPLGLSTGISVACSTDASIVNKATATSSCYFEARFQ